jgi:hypothetical protein
MHPLVTNPSTRTLDVLRFGFEPASALGSDNEYLGLAAEPAPYVGFAGPEHACPFGQCTACGGEL